MIRKIEIENVKGIGNGVHKKIFELDITPNKPSILVAPNGFGKSSFSAAFASMNRDRIKLEKSNFHKEDENNAPTLKIIYKKEDSTDMEVVADGNSNTILNQFDCFVINNQLKAKGIAQKFGGRTNVTASLRIDPIILIDKIPKKHTISYSFASTKERLLILGKAIPNIGSLLKLPHLLSKLISTEYLVILDRSTNVTVKKRISEFTERINKLPENLTKKQIINHIAANELTFLNETPYLANLAEVINSYDFDFTEHRLIESYLAGMQVIELYHEDRDRWKKYCARQEYESDKIAFTKLFEEFNSTWIAFKPKEKDGALLLEFPKAHLISNGQRDVLSFMAMLEKAKKNLVKKNCILIIDEVFDYLDDANLVAVQYYISHFIEDFKTSNRNIYPLILTHLDPRHFKGYVFGRKHKIKTYYLDKVESSVSESLIKILKERNNEASVVKNDIEKYLLHFHTSNINKRAEFDTLGLKPTWGEQDNFDKYILGEVKKYLSDQQVFDPLAVCCAVRKKIEEKVYNLLQTTANQNEFLNGRVSGTNDKLDFAESVGIQINESYSFLGIIYNEALHWKDDRDKNSNISPVMGKLKNLTIKSLIKSLFA